ncbi:MAG TPA: hypothetical protein VG604_04200 [Candidatus Saccharimonadales bacterium]|nr:hypothetical protein [Candidatus Saccharimonadales bacterium]
MSRAKDGKFAEKQSMGQVILAWLEGLAALAIAGVFGRFMAGILAALRSCNANNSDLSVSNCGKQGLNQSDVFVLIIFLVFVILAVNLLQRAWQQTRSRRKK